MPNLVALRAAVDTLSWKTSGGGSLTPLAGRGLSVLAKHMYYFRSSIFEVWGGIQAIRASFNGFGPK